MSAGRGPRSFVAPLALVLALAVGAVACSSDGSDARSEGEVGSAATLDSTSTTAATTTSTTAPVATTVPGPTGLPDAEAAATKLYDAWVADDRATALTIADPTAVDALFVAPKGTYELYRGCDSGEFGTGGCLFRNRSNDNTIQVDLEKRDAGWVVSGIFFSES